MTAHQRHLYGVLVLSIVLTSLAAPGLITVFIEFLARLVR